MDSERLPGRSFLDPALPLGAELLSAAPWERVADRAKGVSVLRKAEEFMRTNNPPAASPASIDRALELAAGRIGLTFEDYAAIVRDDPELAELEARVREDARRRF